MRSLRPTGCILISLFICMSGCTEAKTSGPKSDGAIGFDNVQSDSSLPVDTFKPIDTGPADTYVPEPGEFGWPCSDTNDCYSGWCVVTPYGQICTETCEEDCPANYECRPLLTEGDPVYICLPKWMHLCDPCMDTKDCAGEGSDTGHYCLDLGPKGKFCGGDCSLDGECPSGYDCKKVPVGGGLVADQCVPTTGVCECSQLAILSQLKTSCVISNDQGTCVGARMCTVNGLSDCDATDPIGELCNGLDDNCDGATDNMPNDYLCYKTTNEGTCSGTGTCIGGVEICDAPDASPEVCDGVDNNCDLVIDESFIDSDGDGNADCVDEDDDNDTIPDVSDNCPVDSNFDQVNTDGDNLGDVCDEDDDNDSTPDVIDCAPLDPNVHQAAIEKCDGIDNDCNGVIDDNLCDDGTNCTIDSCNADGSCAHAPDNQLLCDDGSICTQTDKCIDGSCQGLNPIICDDGNQCTDDTCDPVAGCLTAFNAAGCQDGSECTENDTCTNGVCKPGPQKSCDDNNPCTFDQCFPQKAGGCEHPPTNEGQFCSKDGINQCQSAKCIQGNCETIGNAGQSCSEEVGFLICKEDVPGVCNAQGKCTPTKGSCQCTSPCGSFCICCLGTSLCLDFLFN
jgi:hypothetical protein